MHYIKHLKTKIIGKLSRCSSPSSLQLRVFAWNTMSPPLFRTKHVKSTKLYIEKCSTERVEKKNSRLFITRSSEEIGFGLRSLSLNRCARGVFFLLFNGRGGRIPCIYKNKSEAQSLWCWVDYTNSEGGGCPICGVASCWLSSWRG